MTWTATTATPGPDLPELRQGLDPDDVTPGLLGFLVVFAAALACIPLFRSMTGKLRRVEHRARQAEQREHDPAPDRAPGPDAPG